MAGVRDVRLRDGRTWPVYEAGAGPALVWLHGLNGLDTEDPTLDLLARRFRVSAPVAPGFASLADLAEIDDVHDLALAYDDLFEALGLEGVALVGHSFGAMVAAEIAAHVPRRVGRLVLMAPFGLWNDAYPVADIFAQRQPDLQALLWVDDAAQRRFAQRAPDPKSAEGIEATLKRIQGLTAMTKFVWPIPDKGLKKRLPRIAAPTLGLFGEGDGIISPRYAADLAAGIPRCETAVIEGAAHMLPYEAPDDVATRIADHAGAATAAA
ncbi:MAG TPA: alpha/beta fold hydrolase [Hyphomicrobiales bacterium]|nr:alpha/beta fold hydrolase [Hyphomicrobiales bacterium]